MTAQPSPRPIAQLCPSTSGNRRPLDSRIKHRTSAARFTSSNLSNPMGQTIVLRRLSCRNEHKLAFPLATMKSDPRYIAMPEKSYDHHSIEGKWRQRWHASDLYKAEEHSSKPK